MRRELCPDVRRIHRIGPAVNDALVKRILRRRLFRSHDRKSRTLFVSLSVKSGVAVAFVGQFVFAE